MGDTAAVTDPTPCETTKACEFCHKLITKSNITKHMATCKVRKEHLINAKFKDIEGRYKDRIFELETQARNDAKTINILKEIIENMWKPSNHGLNTTGLQNCPPFDK